MIGTMGSRIISFLMLSFYTNILSTAEYGTIDLLLQISNFITPVCTIGVTAGIIRFGLDSRYNKNEVFTTGLFGFGAGFTLCLISALQRCFCLCRMLAVTLADAISVLFLTFSSKLWRVIAFRKLHIPTVNKNTAKKDNFMIKDKGIYLCIIRCFKRQICPLHI